MCNHRALKNSVHRLELIADVCIFYMLTINCIYTSAWIHEWPINSRHCNLSVYIVTCGINAIVQFYWLKVPVSVVLQLILWQLFSNKQWKLLYIPKFRLSSICHNCQCFGFFSNKICPSVLGFPHPYVLSSHVISYQFGQTERRRLFVYVKTSHKVFCFDRKQIQHNLMHFH